MLSKITRWFDKSFWLYLFEKPKDSGWCSWLTRIRCRMAGHPSGPVWFKPLGTEPDGHCITCRDYIL